MKKETQPKTLEQCVLKLADVSISNRISILRWLDVLATDASPIFPLASGALLPNDDQLICQQTKHELRVFLSRQSKPIHALEQSKSHVFFGTLRQLLVKNTPPHTYARLPASLKRLYIWQKEHDTAKQHTQGQIRLLDETVSANESAYFYRQVWQHYRSDKIAIVGHKKTCFFVGHEVTERISIRSGKVRHRYYGTCVVCPVGRVYRVEETRLSRLGADGTTLWTIALRIESLHQGLLGNYQHVVVADEGRITCLDARTGETRWQHDEGITIDHVDDTALYGTTTVVPFRLRKLNLLTGQVTTLYSKAEASLDCCWHDQFGIYFFSNNSTHRADHLTCFDLASSNTLEFQLAPSLLVACIGYDAGFMIVLEESNRQLLCHFARASHQLTVVELGLDDIIVELIHTTAEYVLMLSGASALICFDWREGTILWRESFAGTPTTRLKQARVHEQYLLVPSTPPRVILLTTGAKVGEIESQLYQHAIPVMVRDDTVVLRDDYGYTGSFELSGYIRTVPTEK